MKKIVSVAIAAVFVLGMASCKKDYTCVCKVTGVVDNSLPLGKQKKSDAETACSLYQVSGEVCEIEKS